MARMARRASRADGHESSERGWTFPRSDANTSVMRMFTSRNLYYGAIAGLTGSALMHAFRIWWERYTRHRSRDAIFGFDREADVCSAWMLLAWVPDTISEETAARVGLALH